MRNPPPRVRQPQRRRFLGVELLECRDVPATFTVSTLADTGVGSLRQAVTDANAAVGADSIVFAGAAVGGTISLLTMGGTQFGPNALEVTSTIIITGGGETIARGGAAPNFRLFYVSTAGNLTISGVTLSNGLARGGNGGTNLGDDGGGGGGGLGAGGAIYNQGTVSILNSTLSGNTAQGGSGGVGADNAGTDSGGGGGGGGMGGNGGTTADTNADGGAGGGGFFGSGVSGKAAGQVGGGGGGTTADAIAAVGGVANGGAGGSAVNIDGVAGGLGGGGGGAGDEANGGIGGIGGGGGGGGENDNATDNGGGIGGFGGGGGGGGEDGAGGGGGFGGGGGGGSTSSSPARAGGAAGNFGGTGGSTLATRGSGGGGGGAGLGGAIFNDGTITITGSTLSTNTATGGTGGIAGGTAAAGGVGSGAGGSVFNNTGTVTIRSSTVTLNTATEDGGGLTNAATMTVTGSTIVDNMTGRSGGGIRNVGALTVDTSTIATNKATTGNGGGINNGFLGALSGTVVLTNSTVSGNTAQGFGGGLRNVSSAANAITITNSTFHGNTAQTGAGGGINTNAGTVSVVNTTITNNSDTSVSANRAGGVSVEGGTVTLANSVVANNTTADSVARDVRGTFAAGSKNNFFTFVDANTNLVNGGVNANIVAADPLLGPLQSNGGPTFTRLPLAGSPLINFGNNAASSTLVVDQRGFSPRRFGGTIDIGSVEVGATATQREVLVNVPQFGVGADAGGGSATLFNADKSVRYTVAPFSGFAGGVRTATADFNRDGVADLIVGTGPGIATRVLILDGKTQAVLFDVAPFEASFKGGVYVSAGDVTGDGIPDLAITPDEGGGPRVDVYSGAVSFPKVAGFFGIDDVNFRGGARSAIADMTGDGVADLIVVAGFGGGPRVAGFDGKSLSTTPVKIFGDFFAFEQALRNGIFVTAGDLNGDGFADLIAGGGPGGGPRVLAFDGKSLLTNTQTNLANFFGGNVDSRGGIRVAVKDLDGDARADLVVGSGAAAGSRVTGYLGKNITASGTPTAQFDFDAVSGFTGGVFVG